MMCYNIVMEYNLIREKRKTISMRLNGKGEIIVKAPLKASTAVIEEFITSKLHWIEKQQKRVNKINAFRNEFDFQSYIYLLGQKYRFEDIDLSLLMQGNKNGKLLEFYHKEAENRLPKITEEVAIDTNLKYKSLKLSNSRHVWGSYDRKGNMKLNWRLVILPKELIEYVVIHELCHGVHLNHSKAFWEEVKSHCPDYKALKKQLDIYSFVLQIG